MRIIIGQTDAEIANIENNLSKHKGILKKAKSLKGDIVVFPELSLSGYTVCDNVSEIYVKKDSEYIKDMADIANGMPFIFGGIERGDDNFLYNSAFLCRKEGVLTHRKIYLPTYGMFDEGRFLKEGDKITTFFWNNIKCGIAICEDMWHLSVPYLYAMKDVQILFVLAGSPGKGISEEKIPLNAKRWEGMLYTYSMLLGIYIVFVNRAGIEDGISFWGGSAIYAPGGEVPIKAKYFEEDLIYYDINIDEIFNYRVKAPIMKNEKIELIIKSLLEKDI